MSFVYKKVLLIDDDPINNHLTSHTIKRITDPVKIDIIAFTDPEEGLLHIQTNYSSESTPTVLFLDINMPALSGWDVLDKMNGLDDDILKQFTIYVLSSSIDIFDINKAESNPLVKQFISKPLAPHLYSIFS